MDANYFLDKYGKQYNCSDFFEAFGFIEIEILPQLKGKRWGNLILGILHGFHPSGIRVTESRISLDAWSGRITIYIKEGMVQSIRQEIKVGLPSGVENGEDLVQKLNETEERKDVN